MRWGPSDYLVIVGNGISRFRMGENLHVPTADVGKAGHHVKEVGGGGGYVPAGWCWGRSLQRR